jgi:hypothetical protein
MSNLQKQIELLEARANEAELLGSLACKPETRAYNRRLSDELRNEARRLRREAREQAA